MQSFLYTWPVVPECRVTIQKIFFKKITNTIFPKLVTKQRYFMVKVTLHCWNPSKGIFVHESALLFDFLIFTLFITFGPFDFWKILWVKDTVPWFIDILVSQLLFLQSLIFIKRICHYVDWSFKIQKTTRRVQMLLISCT